MAEKAIHPLEGVRLGPRFHAAPVWPQVEQQFAPTHYVRVPDSPILTQAAPLVENVRQNWNLPSGWVIAWRAGAYRAAATTAFGTLWTPTDLTSAFVDIQLAINSHDQRFTDSENRRWTTLGWLHQQFQGWVPWCVRVETNDVWSWSYRARLAPDATGTFRCRPEIGLQYVSDDDLAQLVGPHKPDPFGQIALARPFPTRWITPPQPYPSLLPGEESAARRIDWQQGAGELVCWSGGASLTSNTAPIQQLAGTAVDANMEVQAAFHDGEHLIVNGSGPDWMSAYLLWGGRGGRRVQPLCRKLTAQDQLTIRCRNIAPGSPISGPIAMEPEVVIGWTKDGDKLARPRK